MATSSRAIPTIPADFLAWESRQRQRYELVGGVARAMRGGMVGHNLLAGCVLVDLQSQLGPGRAMRRSDLKVSSPAGMVIYPDVPARCGPFDEDATEADHPVLIAEILPPSTRREDLVSSKSG